MSRLGSAPFRLARLGPGIAIAATGVGAGDLIAASVCGVRFGTALAWSIVVGAVLKFVVNEGIARWQLATGQTLLEGVLAHLGKAGGVAFLVYLVPWSLFVGSALAGACGVTAHAVISRPQSQMGDTVRFISPS